MTEAADTIILKPCSLLTREALPRLNEQLSRLAAKHVIYDLGCVTESTLETVEVLARLALSTKRAQRRLDLYRTNRRLRAVLDLAGLGEALPEHPLSGGTLQVRG